MEGRKEGTRHADTTHLIQITSITDRTINLSDKAKLESRANLYLECVFLDQVVGHDLLVRHCYGMTVEASIGILGMPEP